MKKRERTFAKVLSLFLCSPSANTYLFLLPKPSNNGVRCKQCASRTVHAHPLTVGAFSERPRATDGRPYDVCTNIAHRVCTPPHRRGRCPRLRRARRRSLRSVAAFRLPHPRCVKNYAQKTPSYSVILSEPRKASRGISQNARSVLGGLYVLFCFYKDFGLRV